MIENNDPVKRHFVDTRYGHNYGCSIRITAGSTLFTIHDGDAFCCFSTMGFVELTRAARDLMPKDKARAIALYYAKFLEDEDQSLRDWPEDAAHENGQYHSTCTGCGKIFIGLKGRTICRACRGTGGET